MVGTVYKKDVKVPFVDAKDISFAGKRSKRDAIISDLLEDNLGTFGKTEINELSAFIHDLGVVEEHNRIRYVAAFDTETTGFVGYACSAAIILYDLKEKRKVNEFYSLINPLISIPMEASQIHKITDEDVKEERTFDQVREDIENLLLKADMFVGHNLMFDLKVLDREYERVGNTNPFINFPYFDTMKYGKNLMGFKDKAGKIKDPKLEEAMEFYGLTQSGDYHNALTDTEATLDVFLHMLECTK